VRYRRIHFTGAAVVVAFDICSSSSIAESLLLATSDMSSFVELITEVKRHLALGQQSLGFDPYKFTGDGWILLFPPDVGGRELVTFLKRLCTFYAREFERRVAPNLLHAPPVVGLTFGIDKGDVIDFKVFGQWEYIGRPVTIACRLQNAVKDKGGSPAYKALVTNRVYREHFADSNLKFISASRVLPNINNNAPFRCRKFSLLSNAP
jgi:class 3 adenylate cyclase